MRKLKKLPTFTLEELKNRKGKRRACAKGIKYYAEIFGGMDISLSVVDFINCRSNRKEDDGNSEFFRDIMWLGSTCWFWDTKGFGLALVNSEQTEELKRTNDDLYKQGFGLTVERGRILADLFTIFLIENGFDVSARKEI